MATEEPRASQKFMDVDITAPEGVLKPRAETEILGKRAVEYLLRIGLDRPIRVIDMCCGSGNLAVAIALHVPDCRVWAADLTEAAVRAAKRNVERHKLSDRIEIRQGDLFAAFAADNLKDTVDLVVCNPPYISAARLDGPSADLLLKEPREAFDGGPFGLSIHQRLIRDAVMFLKPDGLLMCEFGEGQHRQVAALIERSKAYHRYEQVVDTIGIPRVAVVRRLDPTDAKQKGPAR
ncbi:peptide chain release factor N(5)-glutamine methyltransferase [Rhizobium laguerreae]|uniref:N5-glutamine methyltransferase family protein n=1 Tax=Rhizobium laguerreae TaxID=1076926 RepID=UPI001C919B08|nr:peptide chain release factor N(5)-glutamine methyltransferase [Rhizobium laguerreae]MBY3237309.1 peptide chain release factor N(5)-glutamine methyltransferase [Rhizobium laguerreae]